VGCGRGQLGAALKDRQKSRSDRVRSDEIAARQARDVLTRPCRSPRCNQGAHLEAGSFDTIICGDSLEQVSQPLKFPAKSGGPWLLPGRAGPEFSPRNCNVRHHRWSGGLRRGALILDRRLMVARSKRCMPSHAATSTKLCISKHRPFSTSGIFFNMVPARATRTDSRAAEGSR